jgi:non-ribosomal peptide synthase protein (TIGR01720 family)
VPFVDIDLSAAEDEALPQAIEVAATGLQTSLNLSQGPLIRVARFALGGHRPGRLLVLVHHIAVDAVSWRIVLEDLMSLYKQLRAGQTPRLPPKTTSFKQWSELLQDFARSDQVQAEGPYWLDPRRRALGRLPVDYPGGVNTKDSMTFFTRDLDPATLRGLLQEVVPAYQTQIQVVLLAALALAVNRWCGGHRLVINLEGHGREDIGGEVNIARTVGWFTLYYPLLLDLGEPGDLGDALRAVRDQLQAVPNRGLGYLLLRYLGEDQTLRKVLSELPAGEIGFNYMGQREGTQGGGSAGQPGRATESMGPTQSRCGLRPHILDVSGALRGDQLQMRWTFSRNLHDQATIENLADTFFAVLEDLVSAVRAPDVQEEAIGPL